MFRELLSLFGLTPEPTPKDPAPAPRRTAENLSTSTVSIQATERPAVATPEVASDVATPSPSAPPARTAVSESDTLVVVGQNGERYQVVQRSNTDLGDTLLLARDDGAQLSVALSELRQQHNGQWVLSDAVRDAKEMVIPVVEEQLDVSKEQVETARVRVKKTVESHDVVVDEPLKRERVVVEHVPRNTLVTGDVPQVREEDGVTIIPILEEQVVTERKLVLVEEVHIRRESSEYHAPQTVALRREVVGVERIETDHPQTGNLVTGA